MNKNEFDLRRFIFSRFTGALCDQFLLFSVPLAILKATGSLTFSSLAFVIEWLPRIVFFPLSGFMADRIKPRYIFSNVDAARAVLMLIIFSILYFYPNATFPALAIMMALLSIAYVLNFVATDAMLPRQIPSDELPKAHSILQGVEQITMVLGPVLAVSIFSYGGINEILIIAAILFMISSVNYLFLHTDDLAVAEKMKLKTLIESNLIAMNVLKNNKILLHLYP